MGGLTVYRGGAHTGKSTALCENLRMHMQRGEHAILLVPEQATYAAEKRLTTLLGGLLGVEVYSFERFSERLLERFGRVRPFLSVEGRHMVLRRTAYRDRGALTVFSRVSQTRGFAETMDEWIGRLKQSCITPEQLTEAQKTLDPDSLLARKLADISLLYRDSEAFLKERYLTAQDLLTEVLDVLPEADLSDTCLYIDELDRPREQVMRLIRALLLHAKHVTMTIRAEDDPALAALFRPETEREADLKAFCAEHGLSFATRVFDKQSAKVDPALLHIGRQLFSSDPKPYPDATDAVTVTGFATEALEAEQTADRILELVRDHGLKYAEIAIVASSLERYGPLLKRACRLRDIPLFFDASRPILGHAATDFVLSSVRAAAGGWNVDDLLHVLKSGYAGVDAADVELLENYQLRYGLFGGAFCEPFAIGEVPEGAERARAAIMPKLLALKESLLLKTAGEKVRGLYAYLKDANLRERLRDEADALQRAGESQDAQTYAQMWNTLMTLLSQIDAIMGDTAMGMKEFCALLEEGLSSYQIGILPGSADQVVLGDLVRTRLTRCNTLFLLGCSEGVFPPARSDDNLFNNTELKRMADAGLSVWGNTALLSASDRLQLYTLLTKATDRLRFSYACSGKSGDLVASPLLKAVQDLFAQNATAVVLAPEDPLPPNAEVGFSRFADALREYRADGTVALALPALLDRYRNDPLSRPRAEAMLEGRAGTKPEAMFGKALAHKLYGEAPMMSASRLEQFARCPFAQYLKYGLKAEERKEATERADNVGTFLHDALDAFVKAAQDDGADLKTLTPEQADAILDRILPPLIAEHNDGIFSRNARLREALVIKLRLIRWCVYSLLRQLKTGRFRVAATEASFGMGEGLRPVSLILRDGTRIGVYGKIDRIDCTDDGTLFRIVDYKTGRSHTFDPTKFESGETIQLPLYLEAAKQLGGEAVGMYYMPLTADPPESEDETPVHLLSGITANDAETIAASDPDLQKRSTLIRKLALKKDGTFSGDLLSREQIERLKDRALASASRTAERIMDGEADVYPTESACTYCPYDAVCRFDRQLGCRTRVVRKIRLDELVKEGDPS